MKNKKKSFIAMLLVVVVAAVGAHAYAASGGANDPLVSLSYLIGEFKQSLIKSSAEKDDEKVGGLISSYENRLDTAAAGMPDLSYDFAPGFSEISVEDGAYIHLDSLSCFMPVSGASVITADKGEVINISTGEVVPSGTQLKLYNKYFTAENTSASVRSYASPLSGMVEGSYSLDEAQPFGAEDMFLDISGHWGRDYILELYGRGTVNGVGTHVFQPDGKMTRAMIVTILGRISNETNLVYAESGFDDVDINSWYGSYVAWARDRGIVDGYGDGSFKPDLNVTREQLALIINRFAIYLRCNFPEEEKESFADRDKIDAWALDAVEYMQRTGLLSGKNGNLFDPLGTATRAEVCTVMSRFINKSGVL
jgi:hypothetical protein